VSASEGTETTVLVCRTISPFRPSRLGLRIIIIGYMAISKRRFEQLRKALLAFALVRLSEALPLVYQIPPTVLAWSICVR
jgi:hypothetical protein